MSGFTDSTPWRDGAAGGTPLDAAHLNAAEQELADYADRVAAQESLEGQYQGAYSSGTTYSAGQVVIAGGSSYVSLADTNLGNSLSDTSKWGLLAAKGDPAYSQTINVMSARPNAAVAGAGATFVATDFGVVQESDGAKWQTIAINRSLMRANGTFWRESIEGGTCRDNLSALATGTELCVAVPVFEGDGISEAWFWSGTTGYTPGTGTPHAFFTLRKPDGTLVATSADNAAGLSTSTNSRLVLPLALDAAGATLVPPYTATETGLWLVGLVIVNGTGTTLPSLHGVASLTGVMGNPKGNLRRLAGTAGTSLTDPASLRSGAPGPLTITAVGNRPYAGVA